MEILGVGPSELFLVLLLALVLVGPRDLGKHARSAGKFLHRLYRSEEWSAVQQASRNLRSLPSRLAREAEMEERQALRAAAPPEGDPTANEGFAWRRPAAPAPIPPPPDNPPQD